MLNDGTEAILNFVLYPVSFEKNLMESADFLIDERVVPDIESGKLNKEDLLSGLKDALSKDGWKNECAVTANFKHSEETIKTLLKEILKRIQTI